MEIALSLSPRRFVYVCLLPPLLLSGCSSDSRDRLWETLDPAGYKHAHSESFNGAKALPPRRPEMSPKADDMALGLEQ